MLMCVNHVGNTSCDRNSVVKPFLLVVSLLFPVTCQVFRPNNANMAVISVPKVTERKHDAGLNTTVACRGADGCGRTPARTKPAPTSPTTSSPTSSSTPGRPASLKQTCTQRESAEVSCLHGGECYILELGGKRSAYCHCREMWLGKRCEEASGDYFVFSADKVEKAGIAAGVVVVIIIITVVIVYFIIKKRKQRRKRSEENGDLNGHAGKLLPSDAEKMAAAELEETKV